MASAGGVSNAIQAGKGAYSSIRNVLRTSNQLIIGRYRLTKEV
ncbi:hypothetical protein [Francisella philomiragia]